MADQIGHVVVQTSLSNQCSPLHIMVLRNPRARGLMLLRMGIVQIDVVELCILETGHLHAIDCIDGPVIDHSLSRIAWSWLWSAADTLILHSRVVHESCTQLQINVACFVAPGYIFCG